MSNGVGYYIEGDHYEYQLFLEQVGGAFTLKTWNSVDTDSWFDDLLALLWMGGENRGLHYWINQSVNKSLPLFIIGSYEELETIKALKNHFNNIHIIEDRALKSRREIKKMVRKLNRIYLKNTSRRDGLLKFTLRLPSSLDEKISLKAKYEGSTKAKLVRQILEQHL